MADAFARAAAALAADPNLGLDALYMPASGASIPCRLVLSRPVDVLNPQSVAGRLLASLPVAAVPAPARNDQIRIPSLARPDNLWTVETVETDPMRAMHDLTLSIAG